MKYDFGKGYLFIHFACQFPVFLVVIMRMNGVFVLFV